MNNKFIKTLNADVIQNIKNDLENKENKMTQKKIAKKYNVSVATVSRIKTNKLNIKDYTKHEIDLKQKLNPIELLKKINNIYENSNELIDLATRSISLAENNHNLAQKNLSFAKKNLNLAQRIYNEKEQIKNENSVLKAQIKDLELKEQNILIDNKKLSNEILNIKKTHIENKDLLNKIEKLEKEVFLLNFKKR